MVDGKIALSAGSTVPTLEASITELPSPVKDEQQIKPDITSAPAQEDQAMDIVIKSEHIEREPTSLIPMAKPEMQITAKLPGSMFIGDLRLTTLKSRLATLGIPAEFAGEGVLICGPGVVDSLPQSKVGDGRKEKDIVAVRKLEQGKIVLEGAIGKVYFDVRKELYAGYAQVVGA